MVSGPGGGATPGPLTLTVRSLYAEERISSFIRYNASACSCCYVPFCRRFEPLDAPVVGEGSPTSSGGGYHAPLHDLPRLLGESEGQLKADTVAVDPWRSEGRASHRVRLIPIQAVTTLSAQPMSAWLAR